MSNMITFKSRATADVSMLVDTAQYVLGIVGKHLGERGVITVDELPVALAKLEAAMAADHAAPDDHPEHVRIDRRAWPMREMLREALAARSDVLWGV